MAKKGPTLYTPPSFLIRKVKEFAYCVRDKVNAHHGHDRIHLIDFRGLEDGDVMISMADLHKAGEALFVKWNPETTMIDECVRALINNEVEDITNLFETVEEHIAIEDR